MVNLSASRVTISGKPSPLTSIKDTLYFVVVFVPLTPKDISALPRTSMDVPSPAPHVLFSEDSNEVTPLFSSFVKSYPRPNFTLSPKSISGSPSPLRSVQSLSV